MASRLFAFIVSFENLEADDLSHQPGHEHVAQRGSSAFDLQHRPLIAAVAVIQMAIVGAALLLLDRLFMLDPGGVIGNCGERQRSLQALRLGAVTVDRMSFDVKPGEMIAPPKIRRMQFRCRGRCRQLPAERQARGHARANVQYGESARSDDQSISASVAGSTPFAGSRGRPDREPSEYSKEDGVGDCCGCAAGAARRC